MSFNLIQTFKNYFNNRKDQKKIKVQLRRIGTQQWIDMLRDLGLNAITFPIFIIREEWNGITLTLVSDLKEFAISNSIHYWPLDYDAKLLDSYGNMWTWKYDDYNKTNLPGSLLKTSSLEEVKEIINKGIIGYKSENEIKSIVNSASSINGLFNSLLKFNF
jgi:hypothetical protein